MAIKRWRPPKEKLPDVYAQLQPVCHPQRLLKLSASKDYRTEFFNSLWKQFRPGCRGYGVTRDDFSNILYDVLETGKIYPWKEQLDGRFQKDIEMEITRKIVATPAMILSNYSIETPQEEYSNGKEKLMKKLVEALKEPVFTTALELSQLNEDELLERG